MKSILIYCLILLSSHLTANAQSWVFSRTPLISSGEGIYHDGEVLANGDVVFTGEVSYTNNNQTFNRPYLARLNPYGFLLWEREFPDTTSSIGPSEFAAIHLVKEGPSGSMYTVQTTLPLPGGYSISRLDGSGNTIWSSPLQPINYQVNDMVVFEDGSLVTQTYFLDTIMGVEKLTLNLIHLDSNGQQLSQATHLIEQLWPNWIPTNTSIDYRNPTLELTADQQIIVHGLGDFYLSGDGLEYAGLAKFTPDGTLLWSKEYHHIMPQYSGQVLIESLVATPDSGLVFLATTFDTITVSKQLIWVEVDANGDTVSTLPGFRHPFILPIPDMALGPQGERYVLLPQTNGPDSLLKTDPQGQVLWKKEIEPSQVAGWLLDKIDYAPDHALILTGRHVLGGTTVPLALRLDTAGTLELNRIQGYIYADFNANCVPENGEPLLKNWLIKTEPGPTYRFSDTLGFYEALVDSNQHWVSAIPPAAQWSNIWAPVCPSNPDSNLVSFIGVPNPATASGVDFAYEPLLDCSLLQVDIAAPFLRRCSTSTYHVNYCNYGSQDAPNAFIEVSFDSTLTFLSATIPHTVLPQPNSYRFNLGSLDISDCGNFQITVDVLCDTLNPGRTHCATAQIFPDSICDLPSPSWSNASLDVTGTCLPNNNVRFRVRNNGNGNMVASTGVWVVEDDILRQQTTLNLNAGQDTFFTYAGNGSTWALLADQVPFHPGQSHPRSIIEGCGTNTQGLISTGFVTQFGEDDLNPWISIDCQEDIGSYDPNDKIGLPSGLGPMHEILATDEMEYLIRFQNTGNDTAFRVVIRDEIPPSLDLGTFIMGPASHPYVLEIVDGNTLQWTFRDILLPDSATNLAASQGFVKFSIRQQPDNLPGTAIANAANIYFDFNLPILTDSTLHTVSELEEVLVHLDELPSAYAGPEVLTYPNPFKERVTIELLHHLPEQVRLEVFDLNGRLVHQVELGASQKFQWKRQGLPAGIYPFRLSDRQRTLRTGKFIIAEP